MHENTALFVVIIEGISSQLNQYTLCLKKNRTLEIFSNISNKAGPISIIFGKPINMLLLTITILQYVVKQRTSLGFPLAIRAQAGAR